MVDQKLNTSKMSNTSNKDHKFHSYDFEHHSSEALVERSKIFYEQVNRRRTIRTFSDKAVPKSVIEHVIMTASSAPSGAHKQPWTFCAIANAALKMEIRTAAEKEEYDNYHGRMSDDWLEDLTPFGTDWNKPFIEIAPWIIVVFRKNYELVDGKKQKNYYVQESVGIACGFLLTAIHQAGLASLTHTPSPMNFLGKILGRPENEKPYLLIPVGYPSEDCQVPELTRKSLDKVSQFYL